MLVVLGMTACAMIIPAGEGGYDALLATFAIPKALVETIIPTGLKLAPQNYTAPGTHPMVFAFGNQSHVRPVALKAFDVSYLEFIHSVPSVQKCEGGKCRGPFLYSPRLYLNELLPTALGWMYGLNKQVIRSYRASAGAQVIGLPDGPLIEASWQQSGRFAKPSHFAHFGPLGEMMKQPMIGVNALLTPATGVFECSRFDWGLEANGPALIAPATGTVTVHAKYGHPFTEGEGEPRKLPFAGVDGAPLGAFIIRTNWSMSFPEPCELALPAEPAPPPTPVAQRKRVAVLGGGLGAMSAAWYLAQSGEYEVDVYTMGFRLGGKTASGRNESAGYGHRNEEHGLHMMLGWYNNMFVFAGVESPWTRDAGIPSARAVLLTAALYKFVLSRACPLC